MSKGYFTIAQGEMYQRFAYGLALSLKISQPEEYSKLAVGMTGDEIANLNPKYKEVFDAIVEIPWSDHAADSEWKLENEWKAIHMTPYYETIKLDADMLFPADVSFWWDVLKRSDGVFCTQPLTYRGEIIQDNFYRKVFNDNELPNIYTAMFYFKKTDTNFELFRLAEIIFNNWGKFFYEFLLPDQRPKFVSTDVAFALAAKILNYTELNKAPIEAFPTFVHMKSRIQNWPEDQFMVEDWTQMVPVSFNSDCKLKIGNFEQSVPFHYHVKNFLSDRYIATMEKKLGI